MAIGGVVVVYMLVSMSLTLLDKWLITGDMIGRNSFRLVAKHLQEGKSYEGAMLRFISLLLGHPQP